MVCCFLQARSIIPYEMKSVNTFFEKNLSFRFHGGKTERQNQEMVLSYVPYSGIGCVNTAAKRDVSPLLLTEQEDAEPYGDAI